MSPEERFRLRYNDYRSYVEALSSRVCAQPTVEHGYVAHRVGSIERNNYVLIR